MINIGCKFGPDDLPPVVWDELIVLNITRALVDQLVQQRRDKARKTEAALDKARSAAKLPGGGAPGGTLFKTSRPFK